MEDPRLIDSNSWIGWFMVSLKALLNTCKEFCVKKGLMLLMEHFAALAIDRCSWGVLAEKKKWEQICSYAAARTQTDLPDSM